MRYDAIIVGSGPAGIFAAMELVKTEKKVLILDKGKLIKDRICPIIAGKATSCINCPICSVVSGWGGAGSASDGKLTITTGFGGNLEEYIGESALLELIESVDSTFVEHGADPNYYEPKGDMVKETIRRAASVGIKVLPAKIRHIGTDASREVLDNMYNTLKDQCDIKMNTFVEDIVVEDGEAKGVILKDGTRYEADTVIATPGRDGASWLEKVVRRLELPIASMPVDIGVRVEVPDSVCQDLTEDFYEVKCLYNTPTFDDRCRTFCMNPSGYVVSEYNKGHDLVTVNGHSLKNTKSNNTNFSILVTKNFTHPFQDPIGYATHIARLANMLAGGGILVQRLGDLKDGRRSTTSRIDRGMIEQTGSAEPGDLSLVLPHRHMTDIVEFLDALNVIMPGVNQNDTLLYGVEIKLYSLRIQLNDSLEVPSVKNLFMAGDGAGVSRGIIQAASSGIVAARSAIKAMG
ncbi:MULTISPECIES: NAD(P)/FAD-dependent oxidoreductase [Dethiosulfovibrio]|uniref:FAD-dependent oxidoreductase n=2 Tax=Dethiosulfovibrio TaxID=47054 RepID=A0ABS9ETH8_9BACT|nr:MULTISPECIES: FAD-dependent oxidoreductase [Dethiosulfovibrio]MCF4114960.1 FAD-dependent oxidoreductase [Dethiosulfovibrio russensis]MCF4143402.1 FAD-dependent oxidoreductase [Dethiosulfovibrio marinus]MCF4145992.1 FAD-dependent oxidoreductase [Dethiosulfovibrio acidaminovorans]